MDHRPILVHDESRVEGQHEQKDQLDRDEDKQGSCEPVGPGLRSYQRTIRIY
jgi:hypothetical protein